ncbi:MAG TPA: PQQ-binding-like beta-propeller repeat protein, partial [Ktedonobacteraceae bacterium]|nr:PQQ-binding-like beta-propeller repeat protein [Ktedonobacteraceae bacterium]
MKRLFHPLLKGLLLLSLSLTGLMSLVGCGYQNGLTGSNPQGEPNVDAQKPAGSCPDAEATSNDESKSKTAYIVSWDAVATDADNNQGNSVLVVSALDIATGKTLWKKSPIKVSGMYQSSQQQVVDGVLYIVSTNSQSALMLAVDTHDGRAIWQREEKQKNVALLGICASKLYLEIDSSQLQ